MIASAAVGIHQGSRGTCRRLPCRGAALTAGASVVTVPVNGYTWVRPNHLTVALTLTSCVAVMPGARGPPKRAGSKFSSPCWSASATWTFSGALPLFATMTWWRPGLRPRVISGSRAALISSNRPMVNLPVTWPCTSASTLARAAISNGTRPAPG